MVWLTRLPKKPPSLLEWIPEAIATVQAGIGIIKQFHEENEAMVNSFATSPTLYLGTVGPNGEHELYDGKLRFMDADGTILQDQLSPEKYLDLLQKDPSLVLPKYPITNLMVLINGFYRVWAIGKIKCVH